MKFFHQFDTMLSKFKARRYKQVIPEPSKTIEPASTEKPEVHEYPSDPLPFRNVVLQTRKYKPAFSVGFRGWPRTFHPTGHVPAFTLDHVRALERAFQCRLWVKPGKRLVYRGTDTPFNP